MMDERMTESERATLCRRIDELCAENERLRQENQSIGMAAYELGRKSMADENAKLRELIKDLQVAPCCGENCWMKLSDRMRELGIEVDNGN